MSMIPKVIGLIQEKGLVGILQDPGQARIESLTYKRNGLPTHIATVKTYLPPNPNQLLMPLFASLAFL